MPLVGTLAMNSRLLFVDEGTHEAQEYMGLFGHGRLTYLRHWLRHRRRSRRKGKVAKVRAGFARFMATADRLKALRDRVICVMGEPNARLFATDNYRKADIALNAALSSDARTASLMPLFLAESNPTGQGSSLFTEKPNVRTDELDMVLNLDAQHFAESLKSAVTSHYGAIDGPVILRLNNEGTEVEVIRAFHQVFGPRLKAVIGSLSGVGKVKGEAALAGPYAFLEETGIPFLPLNFDFTTWPAAAEKTLAFLDGR
jgi:hypothetical protein